MKSAIFTTLSAGACPKIQVITMVYEARALKTQAFTMFSKVAGKGSYFIVILQDLFFVLSIPLQRGIEK